MYAGRTMGKKKKRSLKSQESSQSAVTSNLCTTENVAYLVEAFGGLIEPFTVARVLGSVENDLDR